MILIRRNVLAFNLLKGLTLKNIYSFGMSKDGWMIRINLLAFNLLERQNPEEGEFSFAFGSIGALLKFQVCNIARKFRNSK